MTREVAVLSDREFPPSMSDFKPGDMNIETDFPKGILAAFWGFSASFLTLSPELSAPKALKRFGFFDGKAGNTRSGFQFLIGPEQNQ